MHKILQIATLLGHAHVEMALACLGSLRRYSADPIHFRIHEDGTLTAEDRDRLAEGLGGPELLARAEADERVADLLARRPSLRALRRTNPLALKLIDVPLLADGDLAYCDSDVLFLRPFTDLFRFPGEEVGAVFMSDRQNAYSVRSWHLLAQPRLALPCRVNSGVLLFRTLFGFPATDATNGFRVFKTSLLEDRRIDLWQEWLIQYELEPYFFIKVVQLGYKVGEAPVRKIYHQEMRKNTKMVPFKSWYSILRPLFLLRFGLKR